jgi:hypothetical protein
MSFSYRNGGASLLDFLDTEKSYRDTRLVYLNLIGSYLTAAAQMNMQRVGRWCNESLSSLRRNRVFGAEPFYRWVRKEDSQDNALAATTGLTPTTVRPDVDSNSFKVEYPEQFPP